MVGELFLGIAAAYLAVAVGTVIWYQRRQRRVESEVQVPVNPE